MERLIKLTLISVLLMVNPVYADGGSSNDGESELVRIMEGQNGKITVNPDETSYVTIWYSPRLDPASFSVTLDGKDVTDRLSPQANSVEQLPIYPRDITSGGRLEIAAESATKEHPQASTHSSERVSKIYTVRVTEAKVAFESKRVSSHHGRAKEIVRHPAPTSDALDTYASERGLSPTRNGKKNDEKK